MKKIFTILAAFFILFTVQAQKSELALNLEKGKEYQQVSNSKVTINQEVAGQKMDMDMIIKGTFSFFVNDITPTGYSMDATFKALAMTIKSPYMTMEFDSASKEENDVYSQIMAKMVNKPFKIQMSKGGKVTHISGVEEMWDEVINSFPEIPDAERKQMKAQMDQAYGGEAMRGNMEMVTAIFPDDKVAIGDEWTVITSLNSAMPATVSTVYKLVERNKDHIVIHGDANINSLDVEEYDMSNGVPMKYDMNGTMKSVLKLDGKSGWILESKATQEINGDVNIGDSPELPGGMTMLMSMKSETVITDHEIQ